MHFRPIIYSTIALSFFSQLHAEENAVSRGFFFDAAALYYQAQEMGLSYVAQGRSIKNPAFEWDFGFKVAFGYQFPRDRWKLSFDFTSLQTHTDGLVRATVADPLDPLWLNLSPHSVESAKMHWRLHLGVFDLLLCREFSLGTKVILQPQIGLSAVVARQKFNVGYQPVAEVRTKNKFFGIGPYCGLSTEWFLLRDFSLFAEVDLRSLYGEFYLHQDEYLLQTKQKVMGLHSIYGQIACALEALLGIRYKWDFSGTLKRFSTRLSWDQWVFFSQNQLMRFQDVENRGQFFANQSDLGLRGVELSFAFDF